MRRQQQREFRKHTDCFERRLVYGNEYCNFNGFRKHNGFEYVR
jgi:hypothetical protein